MAELKLCFVDVETTGLSPFKNEIIDFAVIFENGTEFHFKVKPERPQDIHPRAQTVNGYNDADWAHALDQDVAAHQISELLEGHTIVAHNAKFDYGFVEETLKRHGLPVTFSYHTVDTVGIALIKCRKDGLKSLSLKNVCEFLGVTPEPEIHAALNGARCVKQVFEKLAAYK